MMKLLATRRGMNIRYWILGCIFFLLPQSGVAADLLVTPPLIDLEQQARDVVVRDITVKNQSDSKLDVYVTVNEIAVDGSGEIKEFISPSMDTREKSLTSWIEITRGRIELMPQEEQTIPLTIRIHPYAQTGDYHVFLGFVAAENRPVAEAQALAGNADGVILKVSLDEKFHDSLRITSFLVDRFVLSQGDRTISLNIKNEGTRAAQPSGEVIFYNSLGEEVGSVPLNEENRSIEVASSTMLQVTIPDLGIFGRFKANAFVRYGDDQKMSILDTAQFYLIPLHILLGIGLAIVVISIVVTYLLRRVFYDELQSDVVEDDIPLRIRNDREHTTHDHDIHLKKQ